MVVARNCRRRRPLAVRSSSPTSLTLPPQGHQRALLQQPHHGQRGDRFSRSAFAYQAERLGFADLQRDVVDDARLARVPAESHDEIVDIENDVCHVIAATTSLRGAQRRSNPFFPCAERWIASLRSQ